MAKTTKQIGDKLESEFAKYMKSELDWDKVRVGAHLSGRDNNKGAAVDIIGERLDERGKRFHSIGIIFIITSLTLCFFSGLYAIYEIDNYGVGFLIFAVLFLISSIVYLKLSDKYNKENAWVECKNLKNKVNINHISKSIREFNDYMVSKDKEYKFEYHYFVSASGYVENALKYAIDNGLICYEYDGKSFKRTGYWE